jgi:hypothetical protein
MDRFLGDDGHPGRNLAWHEVAWQQQQALGGAWQQHALPVHHNVCILFARFLFTCMHYATQSTQHMNLAQLIDDAISDCMEGGMALQVSGTFVLI